MPRSFCGNDKWKCAEFQPGFEKSQCEQSFCYSSSQTGGLTTSSTSQSVVSGELKGNRQQSQKNMFELLLVAYTMEVLGIDNNFVSFITEKRKEHIFTIQFLSANSSPQGTPH